MSISSIGFVAHTEDGPSVIYNEPLTKMSPLFVDHLHRLYGENAQVKAWKCGFGESQTKIWVYHHELAQGPYEALAIEVSHPNEEFFVIITPDSGDLLAFRCLYSEDVEKKIQEFFGPKTVSRKLGDNIVMKAKGLFVPDTVPQVLVFRT